MGNETPGLQRQLLRIGAIHPVSCAVFLLVVSVVAAFGLMRLTIDTGFAQLMDRDGSEQQAYLHVAREFGSDNRSFIYLRDENLWTPAKLQALEQLHVELAQLPFVTRVDDLFSVPAIRSVDGQLNLQSLLGAVPLDAQNGERMRAAALENSIAAGNIVSTDGKSIAISVSVLESAQAGDSAEIHAALEGVLNRARTEFPSIVQVGPARIEAEIGQGLMHDLSLLAPLSALAVSIVIVVSSGNLLVAAVALLIGAISLLWTFGIMGFAGMPLSMLSVMLPSLVLVLAATGVVRIVSRHRKDLRQAAEQKAVSTTDGRSEMNLLYRNLGAPSAVLTLSVMVLGLTGYAFFGVAMMRDFSFALAFAILANGVITVLLIPALLAAVRRDGGITPALAIGRWLALRLADAFRVVRHRRAVVFLALASAAVAGVALQGSALRVAHDPLAFFPADSPVQTTAAQLRKELGGTKVFYITLDANTQGAFREPSNLQRLAEIQAFIAKQGVFDRSLSLADIVSQANREAAGGRPDGYRVPPTRLAVGRYLLLHRAEDIDPYVSHDFRHANIVVRHNVLDSSALNQHIRELRLAVAHYAGPTMTTAFVGEGLQISSFADKLPKIEAGIAAAMLVFVVVVMSLMFTSGKGGIIAVVPCAILILMVLALMRLMDFPINMATAMVVVFAIGAAIEGTSRLFSRYSDLCRNATDYEQAVDAAVKSEAATTILIGLALASGFSVLMLSDFVPVAQFGQLASLAMLLAVLVNLLVTPIVMSHIRLVGLYELLAMSMQREALEDCQLFSGLTSYQIRKTILISELLEYREGEHLIQQGTVGRSMYLVVSGQIEVTRHDGQTVQKLALLGPGDVFGEIGFVHETYRTADVRALGTVSVLRFDHDRLKKDLVLFPHIMAKLNFNISGILGRRLAELVASKQVLRQAGAYTAPDAEVPGGNGVELCSSGE